MWLGGFEARDPFDSDLDDVVATLGHFFDAGERGQLLGAVRSVLLAARTENLMLTQKVVELTKKMYGRSSERICPNQLRLALAEMRAESAEEVAPVALDASLPDEPPSQACKPRRSSTHRGRRPLPATLPREEIRISPTAE